MADVKWIRLNTDMFDNAKIKYLRKLPEGNNIVLFWVMLLAKAGKCNSNGYIFLTESIPYSPEMLAAEFDFELNTVNLALMSLSKLNMIQLEEHTLLIPTFDEHQNAEGLDKIREQTKKRVARYREKQKLICNEESNVTVTQGNATEEDIEKEREEEKDICNISKDILCSTFIERILEKWNSIGLTSKLVAIKPNTQRHKLLKARVKQYSENEILQAIDRVKESNFLMGRINDFEITFDWFIRPNNFAKILDGNYKNKEKNYGFKSNSSGAKTEIEGAEGVDWSKF